MTYLSDIERLRLLDRAIPEPNTGCLIWLGATDRGYAIIMEPRAGGGSKAKRKQLRVSRLLCDAPDGSEVLHSCDLPGCINPAHLRLGTHHDNMQDMVRRGRSADVGLERNPKAKLSLAAVAEIRTIRKYGEGLRLSQKYQVHVCTIRRIWQGRSWQPAQ